MQSINTEQVGARRGQCYKTFYGRKLRIFVKAGAFAPGKPFQSSLLFADRVRSLPLSGAPERCFTQLGSFLTCKHLAILERLSRDKHSSKVGKFVTYGRKNFYNISPRSTVLSLPLQLVFPYIIHK